MGSFSPTSLYSLILAIPSIVALVFAIVSEVKIFRDLKNKSMKNILEQLFNGLGFVALMIVTGVVSIISFINFFGTIAFNESFLEEPNVVFSNIYSLRLLLTQLLLLVIFIITKISIKRKDDTLFYVSILLFGIELIVSASFTLLLGALIFTIFEFSFLVEYLSSFLMMPLEIIIALFIFKMLPTIRHYFTNYEELVIDNKFFIIALIILCLSIVEPYVMSIYFTLSYSSSFISNTMSIMPFYSLIFVSTIVYLFTLIQLFVIYRIKNPVTTTSNEGNLIDVQHNEEINTNNVSDNANVNNNTNIKINTSWIERKTSEGQTLDLNNNIVQVHKGTKRGLVKIILLSLITFGIYGLVNICGIVKDLNKCRLGHNETKKSMNPVGVFFLAFITLGIVPLVWGHRLTKRMSEELEYRDIAYSLKVWHYWVFGLLLCETVVCPIIYLHKLIKASNLINIHHNKYGDLKDTNAKEMIVESNISEIKSIESTPVIEPNCQVIETKDNITPIKPKVEEVKKEVAIEPKHEQIKQVATPTKSPKEKLLEAKELFDLGLISEDDYAKVKEEVLKKL